MVSSESMTVGRDKSCSIRIKDSTVSRVHAELSCDLEKGCLLVKDLSSSNGTFVNGKRVRGQSRIESGRIGFGKVTFDVVPGDFKDSVDISSGVVSTATLHPDKSQSLTPTEQVVLELLLDGLPEREAAQKLFISFHTVHNHVRSIYRKLSVRSRPELMAQFVDAEP